MQPRTEVPIGSVPRYVVVHRTITRHSEPNGKLLRHPKRTYYIVDLQDKARVLFAVHAGTKSVTRWGIAEETAEQLAENLNDRFTEGLKDVSFGA